MSDILQTVYNACDPDEPAGVEFYTDCNSARGTDALTREILGHPRLALDQVITDEALAFLIKYSGGHARSLMIFVQNACTYLDRPPITIREARQAVQQAVRVFATSIDEGHWDKLANLARSDDQKIPNGDQDYLAMLENLSVLEYINGGDGDVFESAEPWYAVNPIVCELQRFKAALQKAEMGKEA